MGILEQVVAGILTAAISTTIGWVYNLKQQLDEAKNRITVLETREAGLKELLMERHDALNKLLEHKFENLEGRLGRIERSMNGHA